jgi:hypothetical protein
MAHPASYWTMMAMLFAMAVAARWWTAARAKEDGPAIQFEESASAEIPVPGLQTPA